MARFQSEGLTNKSSKFENFLKKHLDESTFDKIRGYEACIVCWHRENKAFKYVVLSDDCLYLTENPPKSISVAVKFEDIFGIELIDDFPDFLSGQEKRNTTHIEITYWHDGDLVKQLGKRGQSKLPHTSEDVQNGSSGDQLHKSLDEKRLLIEMSAMKTEEENELLESLSVSMPNGTLKSMLKDTSSQRSASSLSNSSKRVTIREKQPKSSSLEERELPSTSVENDESLKLPVDQIDTSQSVNGTSSQYSDKGDSLSQSNVQLAKNGDEIITSTVQQRRRMKLHLYMLVPDSNILVLIRSAVNNHLMRSTLMLDAEYAQRVMCSPRRLKQHSEKIDILFTGLTKELMDPNNTMERQFDLIQELKNAAEKYFHLKKLFWKTGDLFSLFIQILKTYLPKSPSFVSIKMDSDAGRAKRADEFELIILVIQTLALMFRETEIFTSRLKVLRGNAGRLAVDLITVLTCFPEMPTKYVPPTQAASKLLMQTEAVRWKCLADAEMSDLFSEFTSASTTVLFELLVIAQQSHWGQSDGCFFNVCWMMQILEGLNTTEKFIERIITQAMRYIQPSKRIELNPYEAILTFQQFYILQLIIVYSPPLAGFIRNSYTEEFKYYIQGPILCEKLPARYPISARTILLIEDVMSEVLQRKSKLL